ncbi:polysaccharide biosynthesis protein [Adlercreutzia aquisgranensis]|uniref:polysaccharide biosynthesis protein n=1 Tax=Adlercreutzia aquisgranensis TaxID=2941323 RepID=UPI00203BC5C4|nr:nucleoside-diphosphate sugar epimerase/dehydratase [Adlercreutzia aquisgranensis]
MNVHISKRSALLLLFDVVATYAAYWLASLLTDQVSAVFSSNEIYFMLGILALFNIASFTAFRLYNNLWEYASIDEALQIVLAVLLSTLAGAVFLWVIDVRLPIRVFVAAAIISVFVMGGARMAWRVLRRKRRAYSGSPGDRPRTLIVGAGETGSLTIDRMQSKDPNMPGLPVVATDDDPSKQGMRIHGVKVAGTSDDILSLVDRCAIEQIVVAIPSATTDERRRIYAICTETNCSLKTLPNIRELRVDELGDVALRDVDVTDLLGRDEIVLDTRIASGYISGETILVTGGGGSIGSELSRQLAKVAPKRIVLFDMYENDVYMLRQELISTYSDIEVDIEIGNICDKERINEVFEKYHPSVVFHAAAHKHVPLMEVCPREAVQNNVFGTLNVVRASDRFGVNRFIFISTDKAVNPTSVMGATKRMGEMVMQYYARTSKTVFSAVRFGNVLGSNGSVIPLFKRQIAAGGPVTVTHPDIERFFMTIPEAARLVVQAGGMARGGEIFILDMGEPVKILDLAKNLIRLSGANVNIEFTGLRDGEKMYEELLMDEESTIPTDNSSIMVSTGQEISYDEVAAKLDELERSIAMTDAEAIAILEQAVPTYHHTVNRA